MLPHGVGLVDLDKTEHLHEVLVLDLHGGLSLGTLYGVSRQVLKEELHRGGALHSGALVHTIPLEDLSHAAHAQRRLRHIYLIVDAGSAFCGTLYVHD